MISSPSPNFDARPEGQEVDILLMHYTGMRSGAAALERMCLPEAKVSAHYMVEEDGRVFQLVEEKDRAWHAGVSSWAGASDINARSIGIEIVNPGHEFGYRVFPDVQIAAVAELARGILSRHLVPAHRVLGHSDVAPIRKEDPGELFPWGQLAQAGVGMFLDPVKIAQAEAPALLLGAQGAAVSELQKRFRAFGYGLEITGEYDLLTEAVTRAFQRHYCPAQLSGVADAKTQGVLAAYLDKGPFRD
ncbi:MAG: N-acetylmuramoyl-L-alanine amidase [Alphaproteobacteria bacterium]|nr:MAG: N-acetylmuramoyl-L-alanine amidase [Alphaproteobacteria bacterium]